ncbi:dienelactone hydrolase family protein [Mycobacterium simiae]|uniref:dienelactone hydrolase family protein n=1 Tax=Mycobacterium simiae TaxID=1784 RepID=UPI0026308B51|nr:dienelactone hydrolase family protein [Mycobacterium simiae]
MTVTAPGRHVDYYDGEQSLRGYFAPAADGPRPGVLVVPAWLGITDSIRTRVHHLAAAGYSTMAADVFGHPITDLDAGPRPVVTPFRNDRRYLRRRIRAALDALCAQPECDATSVAAMGYCFGGNAVLELARDQAPVRGVVSFHGELDTPLPAGPGDLVAKILVLTGDDDPVVPFDRVSAFRDEMRAAHADWEIGIYSGARHSFTGEGSLGAERTPEAVLDPQADARSWQRMLDFFVEILSTPALEAPRK